jgi:predicted nucleic acid-binding protein
LGTVLDTSVLIGAERARVGLELPADEDVAIAAITVSELLHGVYRADPARRTQRAAFVELVIRSIETLPFDVATARVHAQLWADLAQEGMTVGAHDLQIAATALVRGWSLATSNRRDFARIPGLVFR